MILLVLNAMGLLHQSAQPVLQDMASFLAPALSVLLMSSLLILLVKVIQLYLSLSITM